MSSIQTQKEHYYYFTRINGKQIKRKLDVRTKAQAKKLQDELDMMYARMKLGLRHIETIPLSKLINLYDNYLSENKGTDRYRRLHSMVKNFREFVEINGILTIEEINQKIFNDFKKYRQSCITYRGTNPSDKTINEELSMVKDMMAFAVDNNYLYEFNINMKKVRIQKPKKKIRDPFTTSQLDEIFNTDLYYNEYYKILYYTGMRPIDLGSLEPKDIKTFTIKKDDGSKQKFKYIEKETSKKGVWIAMPIHKEILPYFDLKKKSGLLFPRYHTQGQRQAPYRKLKDFIKKKKWEGNLAVYSLRHNFNQQLKRQNVELTTRALMMGQESDDSNKPYSHSDIEHFFEIMQKFN